MHSHSFQKMYMEVDHERRKDRSSIFCLAFILLSIMTSTAGQHSFLNRQCEQISCDIQNSVYEKSLASSCTLVSFLRAPTDYISIRCNDNSQKYTCSRFTNRFTDISGMSGRVFIDLEHKVPPGRLTYSFSTSYSHGQRVNVTLLHLIRTRQGHFKVVATKTFDCKDADTGGAWKDHCGENSTDYISSDSEDHYFGFWSGDPDSSLQRYLWLYADTSARTGLHVSESITRPPAQHEVFTVQPVTRAIQWPGPKVFIYFNVLSRRPSCMCDRLPCGNGVCLPHLSSCQCNPGFESSSSSKEECQVCPEGKWGLWCANNCTCSSNSVSCRKDTGFCVCHPKYAGARCELNLDICKSLACERTPLKECSLHLKSINCTCKAGTRTNLVSGHCDVCPAGSWGPECLQNCSCFRNGTVDNTTCNGVNGSCFCKPDYHGIDCRELSDQRSEPPDACQEPNEHLVTRPNLPSLYQCECVPNYQRWNGVCVEFTVELIQVPTNPGLGDTVMFYIIIGLPTDYPSNVSYNFTVNKSYTCIANVWRPGSLDETSWTNRPADFNPRLRNVSYPRAMAKVSWHLNETNTRLQLSTTSPRFFAWNWDVSFNFTGKVGDVLTSTHLVGVDGWLQEVGHNVTKDSVLKVSVAFLQRSGSSVDLIDGEWTTWRMFPAGVECPDFVSLEKVYALMLANSVTEVTVDARFLPKGILRVCNTLVVLESDLLGYHRHFLCGYVRVLPSNSLVAVLHPESPLHLPINQTAELDATDSYDPDLDPGEPPSTFKYFWTCTHSDTRDPIPCDDILQVHPSGKGNGTMQVQANSLKLAGYYTVTVVVVNGTRRNSTSLIIYPTPGDSLFVTVICTSLRCTGVNVGDSVALEAVCRNCDNHTVFYNWTMSNDDLQNGSLLPAAVENGHTNGKFLVFRPFALKSGTTYKVTFVASIETGRTGKSTYQFSTKESPTGGTCQISPAVGTSLATRFAVNCSGFRSPNQPLEYRVYATRLGRDKSGFLISYGSESTQRDLVFPAGDERFNNILEIQVEVADTEGGTAYSNLHIRVFPVRVSGTTSLAFVQKTANVLDLLTRFQVLGKTPVQLSNALAIVSFIDDNSAADVRGIDISEHCKLREQVLRFIANVRRTDFETHAQEAAIIDRLASGATLSVTERVMNYSLKVIDEISSYLQLYAILPRGRIMCMAKKLVNALDRLTTVAHAQGKLIMDKVASSISSKQQLSKYSSVFQVVYAKIGTALLKLMRNPGRPLSLPGESSVVGVIWLKVQPSKLMNLSLQISHQVAADVYIKPSALDIESGSTVKLQMVVHEKNFYMSAAGSERVNMPTILMTLQQHGNVSPVSVTELNEPADIFITRRHTDLDRKKWMFKNVNLVDPSTKGLMHSVVIHIPPSNLYDLLVWLNVPDSAPLVNISVTYRSQKGTDEIVYNDTLWPRPSSSLKKCNQFTQDPHLLLLPRRKNILLKSEDYNVIIKTLLPPRYDRKYDELAPRTATVLTAKVTCQALGQNSSSWEDDVCEVGLMTTFDMVHCRCRHLPVISAELSVESYPKDFSKVGFVGVSFNPLLATVVLFLWLTYFIGIYWAHFADIADVGQRGVAILDDNNLQDKYMYLVCTVTGWWHNAGTTARVYIYLNGSETKSRVHQLSDPHRKLFTPGGENWFLLTTPVSIGKVQSVVVFHDNSGPRSDWFLNEVYVQDVQTRDQWHCQYGDWISVNYGPGVLCVELPALPAEKVLRGRRLFHFRRVLTQLIRNEQLWISIFAKSCYSTFTRVQRLTCALCFLLSFALIDLIFTDVSAKDRLSQGVQEYLSFNLYSILVGFISSLVGIPISVLLVGSFSRISPKPPPGQRALMELIQWHATLRPQAGMGAGKVSQLPDWLAKPPSLQHKTSGSDYSFQKRMSWVLAYGEESNLEMSSLELDSHDLELETVENDVDGCKSLNSSVVDRNVTTNALAEKHFMRGSCRAVWQLIYVKVLMIVTGHFTLPWWFWYVSWTFSSLLALVLTFLVLLYGLQINYQSSFDWLTSFLSACMLSFILQTLKLIGNAFFMVFLFKRNAQLEHRNFTYGILRLLLDLKMEELAQSKKLLDGHWRETVYQYPVPQKLVKKMRDALTQDREASKVTRETVMYAIFMVCVTFAAVGEMDIYGAMQTNRLIKFVFANATSGMNTTRLREVDTPASIWTYFDKTLLLSLMATGDGATLGRESFLMGQVRLRQIRQVKQPNDCASHKYTKYLRKPHECLPHFTSFLEDTKNYMESWSVLFDSNIQQTRVPIPATFRLPTLKSDTPHSVQFSFATTGSAPENSSSTTDKMPDPFAEKGGSSTIDSINAASPTSLRKDAWTYQTAAELEESGTMAVLDWYPGGGYTVELPRVIEDARDVLNPLQKAVWIDFGTRAIHVHFNVYCPSLDLVSRVSVWFELSPYGRVVTSMPIYTTKLRKSNRSTKDIFVSVCEVGFVLMTCLYTYCEIRHLMEIGPRKYLFLAWSLVEIPLLILSLLAVILYFRRQDLVSSFILSVSKSENKKFISFNAVQSTDELLTTVKAVLFALTIFKIFKLRLLRHTCQVFVSTLGIATRGLLCFTLSGIIVLTAFAFYIYPSFFYLDGFRSLSQTMQTLFASSIGIVDYSPLFKTEDLFRPMFVLLFVFIFVVLVLCCFVASILEAFGVGRINVWLINEKRFIRADAKRQCPRTGSHESKEKSK